MLRVCVGDVFRLRLLIGYVYACMQKKKAVCGDWVVLERTWFTEKAKMSNAVEVEVPFCPSAMGGDVEGVFLALLAS